VYVSGAWYAANGETAIPAGEELTVPADGEIIFPAN
jgi:hypothetical protein